MLTTAPDTLVLLRVPGLQLAQEVAWDGFGPLIARLAIVSGLIWVLSRARHSARERI